MKKDAKKEKKNKKLKNNLPKRAILSQRDALHWSNIPLGIASITNKKTGTIYWRLNNLYNVGENNIETVPSSGLCIAGGVGSGKTILTLGILSHTAKFSEMFQVLGVDPKRVEFSRHKDKFNCLLLDADSAAQLAETVREVMTNRYKFLKERMVNTIAKLCNNAANNYKYDNTTNIEVNYYTINGKSYQFDEILAVKIPLDPTDKRYDKKLQIFPEGKQLIGLTVETIYNKLQENNSIGLELNGKVLKKNNIKVSKGLYKPKAILLLFDSFEELMHSDDSEAVDKLKSALGAISRLGACVWCYTAFTCQRINDSVLTTELRNNVQMYCLMGGFDDVTSTFVFEKDISDLCKPLIKGRGFIKNYNSIYETQIYEGEEIFFG